MVRLLGRWSLDPKGRGFKSQPFGFQVTTLGKLVTKQYKLEQVEGR